MLHAAGIDPSGMPSLFELLKDEHGEVPEALVWISTHPDHASRIQETEKLIDSLPEKTYTPLDLDWAALQNRVGQVNSVDEKNTLSKEISDDAVKSSEENL